MIRRAFAAAAIILMSFAVTAARAEDALDCEYFDDSGFSATSMELGIVSHDAHFFSNNMPGCPSAGAKCQRPAYVIGGDKVVFDRHVQHGFVCAGYINAKGHETDGWLPAASVKAIRYAPRWIGHWKRYETADIAITGKGPRLASAAGFAIWGHTAPNTGEFGGDIDTTKAVAQIPSRNVDASDCIVMMKQLGPYLFATDNNNCGGMNVTFDGLYVRR